jgi:hypothetical protein
MITGNAVSSFEGSSVAEGTCSTSTIPAMVREMGRLSKRAMVAHDKRRLLCNR